MVTVAELRRENAEQRAQLGQMAVQLGQLVSANAALTAQVAKLNDRVGELLAAARRRQRAPVAGPPSAVAADAALAFADRPKPPELPSKRKAARKPRRRPARSTSAFPGP
ncbi:MAG: hypothetical protein R3B06_08050 [Kofleriaceae bacterium]